MFPKTSIKLLVAQDSERVMKLFRTMIEFGKVPFVFDWAENGKIAVEKVKEGGEYDAILMNLEMPLMNGFEATQNIRSLGYRKPIIAWSGHFKSSVWESFQRVGMDEYVSLWTTDIVNDVIVGLNKCGVIDFQKSTI